MTIQQYEIFNEIATVLNFARAAESLNMSPSAVSHAISSLEGELGFPLFLRSRTKVSLTKEGEQMLIHVREILHHDSAMKEEAAQICGLEKGSVNIGAFSSVCLKWLPDILQGFAKEYPNIEVSVLQGDYDDVLHWVKEGIVDIGFETLPTGENLLETPLRKDRLLCVAPKNYSLGNGKSVRAADLEDETFIIQRDGYDTDTQKFLKKHSLKVRASHRVDDDWAILSFIEKGLGISMMPELAVSGTKAKVKLYPVKPEESRLIGLITQNKVDLSPATKTMLEYIVEHIKEREE